MRGDGNLGEVGKFRRRTRSTISGSDQSTSWTSKATGCNGFFTSQTIFLPLFNDSQSSCSLYYEKFRRLGVEIDPW